MTTGLGLRGTDGQIAVPPYTKPPYTWAGNIVKENDRLLLFDVEAVNLTKGARQGAVAIQLDRTSGYAMTAWDGNPDCGLKIAVNNRAANGTSANGVRAFDIQARNRSTNAWVKTMELNCRNDSGAETVSLYGLHIRCENYGTVGTDIIGLDIEMSSENDTSSPTKDAIVIRNTDASGMTAVGSVIKLSNTSTNGFTNLFDLTGLTAANSTLISTSGTEATTFAGRLRILDAAGSAAYINLYSTSGEA
jgi:hypothetical protein